MSGKQGCQNGGCGRGLGWFQEPEWQGWRPKTSSGAPARGSSFWGNILSPTFFFFTLRAAITKKNSGKLLSCYSTFCQFGGVRRGMELLLRSPGNVCLATAAIVCKCMVKKVMSWAYCTAVTLSGFLWAYCCCPGSGHRLLIRQEAYSEMRRLPWSPSICIERKCFTVNMD